MDDNPFNEGQNTNSGPNNTSDQNSSENNSSPQNGSNPTPPNQDPNPNSAPSSSTTQSRSHRTRPVRSNFYCHACERNFEQVIQESEEPTCTGCGSSFCEKLEPPPGTAQNQTNSNQPLRVQHQVIQHAPNAQSHVVQLQMDMGALESGGTAAMAQQIMQQIQGLNLPGVNPSQMPAGISFEGGGAAGANIGTAIQNMIQSGMGGLVQNLQNAQNSSQTGQSQTPNQNPLTPGNQNPQNSQTPGIPNILGGFMQMIGPNGQNITMGNQNPGNFAWGPDGMQNVLDRLLSEAGQQDQADAGLDEQTINRINTYELSTRQVNRLKDNDDGDCAVCMAEFQTGSIVKKLPPCGHVFHCDCIDSWLRVRKTCPICRAEVVVEANASFVGGAGANDDATEPEVEEESEADRNARLAPRAHQSYFS